ncbi:ABC transporter permease [Enterococcus sp. LJL51]|uniref:ABC transporter permease n=1 Tax=Enterococcus sp. LJL51 TaxID=3416656 RepID=UPI003CF46B73
MKTQKKIIRSIGIKSFRANKRRNIFVSIAIILTTVLLTSVVSLGMSFLESNEQQQRRILGTMADANMNNLTAAQYKKLSENEGVEAYGTQRTIGMINPVSQKKKDAELILHWYDESEWLNLRVPTVTDIEGQFPKKKDEVLIPLSALTILGIEHPKIGMEIPLTFTYQNQTITQSFTLSGYFKEYVTQRVSNMSYLLVSSAFAAEYPDLEGKNTVSIKYKNSQGIGKQNDELAKSLALTENQEIKTTVRESGGSSMTLFLGVGAFILIILLSGGLLIYNVLYISIANDIRFYGLLKALGTTGKQIRSIILRQALILSLIGIPIGLILGSLVSTIAVPFALNISTFADTKVTSVNPWIYISAAVFALFVTLVSSIKPARIAAKVPAIQAIRFTESAPKKQKVRGHSGGKLYAMAWRNIFRDKKRALVVILSLFLGISLFIATNTALESMDLENFVTSEMSEDLSVSQKEIPASNRWEEDQELLQQMNQFSGIEELHIYLSSRILVDFEKGKFSDYIKNYNKTFKYGTHKEENLNKENFFSQIIGMDTEEIRTVMEANHRSFDEEAFEVGELCLVQSDTPEDFKAIPNLDFTVLETQQKLNLPIGGYFPIAYLEQQSDGAPTILISKNYMKQIIPKATILEIRMNFSDEEEEAGVKLMTELVKQRPYFHLMSKKEQIEAARTGTMTMRILGNALAVILAAIGLLNFINVITTSIISRKQELATLESIGMTRRQTNKMLAYEGLYYGGITAVLVLTLGMCLTYGLFLVVKNSATFAVFSLPLLEVSGSLLLVFLVCLLTPILVMKALGHDHLANRIK